MNIMTRLGQRTIDTRKIVRFPRGLMGYEERHAFTLLQISPGAPFLVLQSIDDPGLGLLVADPYSFIPDFRMQVSDAEQALLGVSQQEEIAVLVTASIPHGKPELAALNLTGPILINHARRVGIQIIQNAPDFPARWAINGNAEATGSTTEQAADQAESTD